MKKEEEHMGVKEVAGFLGWDRRRVSINLRRGNLPEPVARLASGPVWHREQIEEYKKMRKRSGLPD